MERVTLVCKDCGHEQTVDRPSNPEEEQHPVRPIRTTCPKCGSRNIVLRK